MFLLGKQRPFNFGIGENYSYHHFSELQIRLIHLKWLKVKFSDYPEIGSNMFKTPKFECEILNLKFPF